jgi:porphobilinogen synthase
MQEGNVFRGRRLRQTAALRRLVREHELRPQDLIQPYFVVEHENPAFKQEVPSMPGQYQLGPEALLQEAERAAGAGLQGVILFGVPRHKDEWGSQAYHRDGIIQQAVRGLKERLPELTVITDVCLCEYTSHGHCGIIDQGRVLNDPTLELLAETALSHAEAGADVVAPSDMMDGRVAAIRKRLDGSGFAQTPILSYAVKYASGFYGPFRDAAQSAPSFGDRNTYQMDPANRLEARREAEADIREGADMLMVKPALPYLDVLRDLRERYDLPLAAYQVSGEYAMIKAAASKGWLDEERVVLESLTSMKRAGADLILSYFSLDALRMLHASG